MIIKLENRDDIEKAARLVKWLSRPTVEKVMVLLPGWDESRRTGFEKKLKFLFNDCGCLWAAPVFLFTFIPLFVGRWYVHGFSWGDLGVSFLIGACAAFTAKFLALAGSYKRLKTYLRKLKDSEAVKQHINREGGKNERVF